MTAEEPELIASHGAAADTEDDLPVRTYWWSVHRPETYAIAALSLAFAALLSIGVAQDIAQAILFANRFANTQQDLIYILDGVRLGLGVLAIIFAALSIRSEDEDTTWSPPVARAALLLAVLVALLAGAALITAGFIDAPDTSTNF